MGGPELPETPAPLKSIHPYLKIANEHDQRDPVVSYWCRLYALQSGLKLSTKTGEETNFLLKLMDWLETTKKAFHENEAVTNDVAAQAHLENWALKLFLYADKNDRASNFGKNVIQSFFTAGLLYDVLTIFGDLSEEATQNRKYAKWKAAYIHNCLKNGQTPVPGPAKDGDDNSNEDIGDPVKNEDKEVDQNNEESDLTQPMQPTMPSMPTMPTMPMQPMMPLQPTPPTNMGAFDFPSVPDGNESKGQNEGENNDTNENDENHDNGENHDNDENHGNDENHDNDENHENHDNDEYDDGNHNKESEPHPYNPAPTPTNPGANNRVSFEEKTSGLSSESGVSLTMEQSNQAQKYIKWAGSALNYDDVPTAITNLRKVLHLLTTGEDPA